MSYFYKIASLTGPSFSHLDAQRLLVLACMFAILSESGAAGTEVQTQPTSSLSLQIGLSTLIQAAINPLIFWGLTQHLFATVDAAPPPSSPTTVQTLRPMTTNPAFSAYFSGISLHGFDVNATTSRIEEVRLFVVGEIHNLAPSLSLSQIVMRGLHNKFPGAQFLLEKRPEVAKGYTSMLGKNVLGIDTDDVPAIADKLAKITQKMAESPTLTTKLQKEAAAVFKEMYADRNKRFVDAVQKKIQNGMTVVLNIGVAHLLGGPHTLRDALSHLAPTCVFAPRGLPEISESDYIKMYYAQHRAQFLGRAGRLEEALANIDTALTLSRTFDVLLSKATLLKAIGDPEALKYFSESLALQPSQFGTWETYIVFASEIMGRKFTDLATVKMIRQALPTAAQVKTALEEGLQFGPSFEFNNKRALQKLSQGWNRLMDTFNKQHPAKKLKAPTRSEF